VLLFGAPQFSSTVSADAPKASKTASNVVITEKQAIHLIIFNFNSITFI
jgi:hypothetical protein